MALEGAAKSSGGSVMNKRDSVNKKLLCVGAICSLISLFTACEALGPEPEPVTVSYEKAVVRVQIGNGVPGRTVMPDIAPPGIDKWELWGGKGDDTDLLLTFDVVADATIALEPGEWSFTIEGYKSSDYILSGSIANQTIRLEETQTLVFEVEPVKNEGSGDISITINLPADSGVTSVEVFKDGVELIPSEVELTLSITPVGDTIVFTKTFPVEEYRFSFKLYNEDSELLGVVSEMVHVWADLTSAKTYTLLQKDLNLTYTISYLVYNEATQEGDKIMPDGHYQIAATTTLATPPSRDDYYFKGWYERPEDAAEDALSGSAVTKIPLGSTGNRAFYAKWIPKTLSGYSLEDALAVISASPEDGDDYTIVLDKNETWTTTQDLTVTGGKEITITIEGSGKTIKLDSDSNGSLFTLGADTDSSLTLILQDITLEGKDSNNAPVVQVKDGGTLELQDGSLLTGNTSSASGGGVSVAGGGTLTISGGTISGNSSSSNGGGVSVASGAKVTMSDGEISGNKALGDFGNGGGVYIDGGTFEMSGGKISGNKTPSSSGGSTSGGGGVFIINGGTFSMSDGAVSGNTSNYDAGGVFVYSGTFEMSGGAVSGNTANYAGGVYLRSGGFTMSDGVISGNEAKYGGGVYAKSGTFTMSGGVIYGSEEEAGKKNTGNGAAIYRAGGTSPNTTNATIDMRQVTP
jgi:uncharacterized repeat protein (TIGR02543 family)